MEKGKELTERTLRDRPKINQIIILCALQYQIKSININAFDCEFNKCQIDHHRLWAFR